MRLVDLKSLYLLDTNASIVPKKAYVICFHYVFAWLTILQTHWASDCPSKAEDRPPPGYKCNRCGSTEVGKTLALEMICKLIVEL